MTDKYYWNQTLAEVTVNIYLEDGLAAKQLKVDMGGKKMSVKKKTGEVICEGEWFAPIKTDDSLWAIESDKSGRLL
jgi:hypothetical protein